MVVTNVAGSLAFTAEQANPGSTVHVLEQPSALWRLPSSHASPVWSEPSPQIAVHTPFVHCGSR